MKKHNPLLYPAHEAQRFGARSFFNTLSIGLGIQSTLLNAASLYGFPPKPFAKLAGDVLGASHEMSERFAKEYTKPAFNLATTKVDGKPVAVTEEVVSDKAFGNLLHFKRDTKRNDPKLLIVAPMSGHYATLLRDTVAQMLPNHDVYITDWKDAREVPLSKGDFGFDDYVSYVKDFLKTIGPDAHVMAVCQPTVPVLAAVSRLAQEDSKYQPLSMTLMGGPIDTRVSGTEVTDLAKSKPISWFEENLIGQVPANYKGAGRLVYPGFVQLFSFMSMHPDKHTEAHIEMFESLVKGDREKADKRKAFYDEYLAVCDLPAKFYLETVQRVFIDQSLAKGTLTHEGDKVDPGAIKKTSLFMVEGERDDISALGQTTAAATLTTALKDSQKFHYVEQGAGHYGIFNGHGWREDIAPRVTGFIRDAAKKAGLAYDAPSASIMPEKYEGEAKAPVPATAPKDPNPVSKNVTFGKKPPKLAA